MQTESAAPRDKTEPMQDVIREYAVMLIGVMRRNWKLLFIPIGVTTLFAFAAVKAAPTKYVAKTLLMLPAPPRTGYVQYSRQNAVEQVAALEAWLKSDHVMDALLPQLLDEPPKNSQAAFYMKKVMLASLTLELVGGSALEIRLEGAKAQGLGAKLELIVGRLMEGLVNPEKGILNAYQLIAVRKQEAVTEAERALNRAVADLGFSNLEQVKGQLKRLYDLERQQKARDGGAGTPFDFGRTPVDDPARAIAELRRSISSDQQVVSQLEKLFTAYQARIASETGRGGLQGNSTNYVGIFEQPSGMLLLGRPQDPVVGENSARKIAIAAIFVSALFGAGLTAMSELLSGRLSLAREFRAAAGVPVIGRLPPLPT